MHKLLGCLDEWVGCPTVQRHAIKLLFLYASRFGELNDAGNAAIKQLSPDGKEKIGCGGADVVAHQGVVDTVALLDRLVNHATVSDVEMTATIALTSKRAIEPSLKNQGASGGAYVRLRNGEEVLRTCSFVETARDSRSSIVTTATRVVCSGTR